MGVGLVNVGICLADEAAVCVHGTGVDAGQVDSLPGAPMYVWAMHHGLGLNITSCRLPVCHASLSAGQSVVHADWGGGVQ